MFAGIFSLILGLIIFVGGAALGSLINSWCFFIMAVGFIMICFGISELKDPLFKNDKDSTKKKILLHIFFIFGVYIFAVFISFFIQIITGLYMIVPFNIFLEILAMFIYDAFVFSILNNMPYIRGKHFFIYLLLPTLALCVIGIIVLYFVYPFEIKNASTNELARYKIIGLVTMFAIPYLTIIIGYLRHNVKCKKCGTSGFCLMVRKDRYVTEIISSKYKTTEYGKIGEIRERSSNITVADVYGNYEKEEIDITENRHYKYNYKCKCCGNIFEKNWTAPGITIVRKIKDKIGGATEE